MVGIRKKLGRVVSIFAVGVLAGGVAVADGPVGEWKLEAEFGGQVREFTLKIREEGGELKGILTGQRGDQELDDVSFEDGVLKYTLNLERDGQAFSLDFNGTIDGDELDGNYATDFGDFPVTGTRGGGAKPSIVGTWKLMVDSQLGENERKLVVNEDLTGTYGGGDFPEFEIKSVTVDGSNVEFDVTLALQGQELPSHVTLALDGDSVTGELDYGQGAASIKGQRAGANIVGTWALVVDSELGSNERQLVVKEDLTGTYGGGDFANFPISDVAVDGAVIEMKVTLDVQGQELPSTIKLNLDGDNVTGTLDYGAGEATIKGKRAA